MRPIRARERRMVTAIHAWKLQRIAQVLRECMSTPSGRAAILSLLDALPRGRALETPEDTLDVCRVREDLRVRAAGSLRIQPARSS